MTSFAPVNVHEIAIKYIDKDSRNEMMKNHAYQSMSQDIVFNLKELIDERNVALQDNDDPCSSSVKPATNEILAPSRQLNCPEKPGYLTSMYQTMTGTQPEQKNLEYKSNFCPYLDKKHILHENKYVDVLSKDRKIRAKCIDDHDSSILGKGETLGILKCKVTINNSDLDECCRHGLFKHNTEYDAILRYSHTIAGDHLDTMRAALKVNLRNSTICNETKNKEVDMTFTEGSNIFPIPNRWGLYVFVAALIRNMKNRFTSYGHSLRSTFSKIAGTTWYQLVDGKNDDGFSKVMQTLNDMNATKTKMQSVENLKIMKSTSLCSKSYFSMTPYAIINKTEIFAFKYALIPNDSQFPRTNSRYYSQSNRAFFPDTVRDLEEMLTKGFSYALKIQVARKVGDNNLQSIVNYSSLDWNDEDNPYITVGSVTIPKQELNDDNISKLLQTNVPDNKCLYFNPLNSPNPGIGDVNLFRGYLYSKYEAAIQHIFSHGDSKWEDAPTTKTRPHNFFEDNVTGEFVRQAFETS